MRWVWVVVVLGLIMLGAMVWIAFDVDKPKVKKVSATIVDAIPWEEGLIITVNADGKFYRIYTNATMINTSESIILHFKDGKLVKVLQNGKTFGVLKYSQLKTLEKIPVVTR